MFRRLILTAALLALSSLPALAHLDPLEHGSFAAGFSHPLFGLDHILAMVAVGLWAALLGGRSVWQVPSAFVAAMIGGFALAMSGLSLPLVEPAVAVSVVVVGLLALAAMQVPATVGMAMVGFFAVFHGHAHGGELGVAGALSFCAGFAFATALLHGIGVGSGFAASRFTGGPAGRWLTRAAGGLTALAGLLLAAGA